jgi:hypothetical protein
MVILILYAVEINMIQALLKVSISLNKSRLVTRTGKPAIQQPPYMSTKEISTNSQSSFTFSQRTSTRLPGHFVHTNVIRVRC